MYEYHRLTATRLLKIKKIILVDYTLRNNPQYDLNEKEEII